MPHAPQTGAGFTHVAGQDDLGPHARFVLPERQRLAACMGHVDVDPPGALQRDQRRKIRLEPLLFQNAPQLFMPPCGNRGAAEIVGRTAGISLIRGGEICSCRPFQTACVFWIAAASLVNASLVRFIDPMPTPVLIDGRNLAVVADRKGRVEVQISTFAVPEILNSFEGVNALNVRQPRFLNRILT